MIHLFALPLAVVALIGLLIFAFAEHLKPILAEGATTGQRRRFWPPPKRWTHDHDRFFGPFTYARDKGASGLGRFGIMLDSGDGDEYPGCSLRLHFLAHTLILALPPILKPYARWVPASRPDPNYPNFRGYFDRHSREFGFTIFEGTLHYHFGPQTHDSETTRSGCWFFPWRCHRLVRHSLYNLDGDYMCDLPNPPKGANWRARWAAEEAIKGIWPKRVFAFVDFDGEHLEATVGIEEREWRRGEGRWRWLGLFFAPTVTRSLDIRFSGEVGPRKGSYKGGTVGHSITLRPGELHEHGFARYCAENRLTFAGPVDLDD